MRRILGKSCYGKRILWVDDHPDNNRIPCRILEDGGATVILALSTEDATAVLNQQGRAVDLVISDMGRGDDQIAGIKVLEYLRDSSIRVPAIIYSDNPLAEERHDEIQSLGGIGPLLGPKRLIERVSCLFVGTQSQQRAPLPRARGGLTSGKTGPQDD
jgi:CheY-like chemotaxis protein